ncbi:MAG: NAD(P)H-binding protein [Propioniciclava sp.]
MKIAVFGAISSTGRLVIDQGLPVHARHRDEPEQPELRVASSHVRSAVRQVLADHEDQEAAVRASGLDWTIVRPSAFVDDPQPGLRHGFGPAESGLTGKVGRAQVAEFLLAETRASGHVGQWVALSA